MNSPEDENSRQFSASNFHLPTIASLIAYAARQLSGVRDTPLLDAQVLL